MTRDVDFSSPRRTRLTVAIVVVMLHVVLVIALIRAFAPAFTAQDARQVVGALTVTITVPPPKPPAPAAKPTARAAEADGAAADAGKRALAKPVAAPSPRIVIALHAAAPVAGRGNDPSSGARDIGSGTGAGGAGNGPGSGTAGNGSGGGGASKPVKIAGDINSARDYPAVTRAQRLGDYVVVALTIDTDGRVKACRVHRPSRDARSDQITCRLATERFRFRPATDFAGKPVESVYGWQQRWFDPHEKN